MLQVIIITYIHIQISSFVIVFVLSASCPYTPLYIYIYIYPSKLQQLGASDQPPRVRSASNAFVCGHGIWQWLGSLHLATNFVAPCLICLVPDAHRVAPSSCWRLVLIYVILYFCCSLPTSAIVTPGTFGSITRFILLPAGSPYVWLNSLRRLTTAGLAIDCRLDLRWHFCCRGPISNPRPVLDSSVKTKRGMLLDFWELRSRASQYLIFFAGQWVC